MDKFNGQSYSRVQFDSPIHQGSYEDFPHYEIRECLYHDNTEPEFDWTQVPQMVPCTDQSEIPTTVKQTDTNYPYIFTENTFITA
jgi:hypothetical protein